MAISLHTAGSWAYAASGSVTPTLPAHSAGDMLIVRVAAKSSNIAALDITCATAGWARVGQFRNGTTNSGNGTGSVQVASFYKEAASGAETNPQIDFSQTVTQVGHEARSYQKGAGETWQTPVGDGGGDTSAGTSHSATIQSHVSATVGDLIDFFTGICDDTTMTLPTFTQAGATLDAVTESPAAAGTDTSGADGAYDGGYRKVTAGTSSAAAVVTGTTSTSETGTSWTTRLRVFTPETHSGSVTATGGGIGTLSGTKNGKDAETATGGGAATLAQTTNRGGAVTATGGGIATLAAATARSAVVTGTGAGVAAVTQSTGRSASMAVTGGGTAVVSGLASETHSGSVTATGGGVAAVAGAKAALAALVSTGGGAAIIEITTARGATLGATGGGAVTVLSATARASSSTASGAGIASITAIAGRFASVAATGGGSAIVGQVTSRAGAVTGTGGGIATLTGSGASGESHSGTVVATGGGLAIVQGLTARAGMVAATGSGAAIVLVSTARFGSVTGTGGGAAIASGGAPAVALPAHIVVTVGHSVPGGSVTSPAQTGSLGGTTVSGTITPRPFIAAEIAQ